MERLKELVDLISLNKVKHVNVIGVPGGQFTSLERLYRGIHHKRVETDKEGLEFIYGGKDQANADTNFTRLKKQLFRRLLNTLFFIDVNQPSFNEIQRAYYSCYKDYAALKMLQGRGARKSVRYIGDKILKKAIKFEFTELSVDVLRVMRMEYGSILGDQKRFREYNKLFHYHSGILRAEELAEEYYTELSSHFVKSGASKPELAQIANFYAERLGEHANSVGTQRFILLAYMVFAMRYQVVNDYSNTLKVSQEALEKLEAKGYLVSKTSKISFLLKVAVCQIQLRYFSQAESTILVCKSLLSEGTLNWFVTQEIYLILAYHTKDYQKGLEIFNQAVLIPGFKKLPEVHTEKWTIHEAYLSYFMSLGKIDPGKSGQAIARKFRVSKFLNAVPVYSNDKRGWNISILILQVLFLINQKKMLTDEVETRLDALKTYSHRHLRKSDTFRTDCFIHMLQQLPFAHYNRKLMVVRASKFANRLKEVPIEIASQSEEIELVPYEDLWELVLDSLKP